MINATGWWFVVRLYPFSFGYNPYTDTGNDNPYYFNAYYSTGVAGYAVALGILFGSYTLLGITVGIVYWMRQKRRKAWYGPMAQYYRQSGVGGYQGNYASGGAGQPYQPPIYQPPPPSGTTPLNTACPPSNNTYGAPPPGAGGATGGFKDHSEVY